MDKMNLVKHRMRKNTFQIGTAIAGCAILAGTLFYLSFFRGRIANASPVPELLSALPAGAPTLVYVDLAAVRASSFYQHRPDKGPLAIPNKDYSEFVRSTGFDFEKDLDGVVIASWPTPSDKEPRKSVAIAEGRFDRAKIRDYARRNGKLEQQQGHEVFLFPSGDQKGWNSVTFLNDHRLALVAGTSVAILFAAHPDNHAADPAREHAARLDGAAAFAVTNVPPLPDNAGVSGVQGAASAQLMSLARSVQWITLAARPEGDNLRVSLEGECDNSSDARQIQSILEVMRMFGRAGLESPKTSQSMDPATLSTLQTLLSNAEVTQAAERVRILIEVTPEVWKLKIPAQQPH
jgi:hypothetical protein